MLAAALDSGLAISGIVIFFAITYGPGLEFPSCTCNPLQLRTDPRCAIQAFFFLLGQVGSYSLSVNDGDLLTLFVFTGWGNEVWQNTADNNGTPWLEMPSIGYFGGANGTWS